MRVFIALALVLISAWAVNYFGDIGDLSPKVYRDHRFDSLIKAGDECVAISERATAHLVPKLEFQRLELAGRKANVVVRCMADHHFYQNPAWLKYAEPVAEKISAEQHISVDEAIENLKRVDMLIFDTPSNKPIYWQYVKKPGR